MESLNEKRFVLFLSLKFLCVNKMKQGNIPLNYTSWGELELNLDEYLLTKLEVHTKRVLSHSNYIKRRGKFYSTDRVDEVSKMFIISFLCV